MSRNTPATTIVLECSNADTGVGPSIAEGNQDVVRIELIFLLQLGVGRLMVCLGIHCLV